MELIKAHKKFCLCLGLVCLVYLLVLRPIITDSETQMNSTEATAVATQTQNRSQQVETSSGDNEYVYITGAVETPGLYKLQEGQTVGDMIQACGGLLPYASVDTINLAEKASSGSHIHVAFNFMGNPEELLRKQKININTANEQELVKLSGVGPGTAKKIIAYREQSGLFKSIEDIKKVKGIGEATFKKLAPHITV
ncbi:helix-hairpin-helix domain-containing protein [Veillonella intestinalis]|uniref:helix-hairpin-helix domain-containing protein n=1 Tax=Veillonella intestinalis TaxID=2941341 RepID=UPI00204135A1|nr:helix-hairpin-helix domain-containing protein [Veillonella intestinalis]